MAETFDVAARLAEGQPAVDNVGDYVWACHLLGYQNPDLTLHAAQVRDWYGSEDGLDLRALEADRAALDAAAAATESARRLQERTARRVGRRMAGSRWRRLAGISAPSWGSIGGGGVGGPPAADAFTALRDELWHAVDGKVAAAVAIDDRRQAQRGEWLAAAKTVTTGAGDRATASELIDQAGEAVRGQRHSVGLVDRDAEGDGCRFRCVRRCDRIAHGRARSAFRAAGRSGCVAADAVAAQRYAARRGTGHCAGRVAERCAGRITAQRPDGFTGTAGDGAADLSCRSSAARDADAGSPGGGPHICDPHRGVHAIHAVARRSGRRVARRRRGTPGPRLSDRRRHRRPARRLRRVVTRPARGDRRGSRG